jgi:hypothetical protein
LLVIILSIVAGCSDEYWGDSVDQASLRERLLLADDIPLPPDESFRIGAGIEGSVLDFGPMRRYEWASFGPDVLTYYQGALEGEGWELLDKEVADDGAWTAGWSKDERMLRLTFGPRVLSSNPTLRLERCPPLTPGNCGPGTLNPMPTSS